LKKLGKADKKPEDLKKWDEEIVKFEEGAKANGLTNEEARKIANDMLMMSSYSFNKSHAVAYSYNGLITMYLTYYFRKYFYSAIIEYTMDRDRESVPEILKQIKSYGYTISPPDVNTSKAKTFVDGNTIHIGLRNLKQIGDEVAEAIVNNAPYKDFADFLIKSLENSKINKRSISSLVKFGCFDKLESELNRRQMINAFTYFWDEKKAISKSAHTKHLLEKCSVEEIIEQDDSIRNYINTWLRKKEDWKNIDFVPVTTEFLKELEQETIGFNYFISPFSEKEIETFAEGEKRGLLKSTFNSLNQVGVSWRVPVFINKMRIINDKNGNEMAFVDIEDMAGNSASIPVFASFWKFINNKIIDKSVCLMFLYRNDKQQIMFGLNKFVNDENTINKFVVPIRKAYG
jgi:DNA polymerase-3 subunit alpha